MAVTTGQDGTTTVFGGRCSSCRLAPLCLPGRLDADVKRHLDGIMKRRRPQKRGAHLYRAGDAFASIYAVKSGAYKAYRLSESGEMQIVGFHLPGDILGLDALAEGHHPYAVQALEMSSVCEIPFTALEDLFARVPALRRRIMAIMSGEILTDHETLHMLAKRTAEERLALMLLRFSDRFARLGLSAQRLRMPMPRSDLGNHLGLANETMSRLFGRFQNRGWISAEGREIVLRDIQALRTTARLDNAASGPGEAHVQV